MLGIQRTHLGRDAIEFSAVFAGIFPLEQAGEHYRAKRRPKDAERGDRAFGCAEVSDAKNFLQGRCLKGFSTVMPK